MKTYFQDLLAALNCNDTCSLAAVDNYILMQVTARAIIGLREKEGGCVRTFSQQCSSII